MYDLVDLLEKAVKTSSLRPVLSSGEVETLRTSNLPTKSHNNVVVLVVNDSADKDLNQKIEGFFKELNSQNDVTVIESEEKLQELWDLKESLEHRQLNLQYLRQMVKSEKTKRSCEEFFIKFEFEIAQFEKKIATLVGEQMKENEETKTIITSTMDNWIQNQGWL